MMIRLRSAFVRIDNMLYQSIDRECHMSLFQNIYANLYNNNAKSSQILHESYGWPISGSRPFGCNLGFRLWGFGFGILASGFRV